ncbi:hypothetical protein YK48G_14520 [Lentilactobacillus fungorum]|uniref:Transposase n=1 Tax=Lentilactobacillus fungorum TaxID=2201250 RepID=A0ABQ3W0M2_9LACO|nr:hypothetical protein [Lentilactobacillus fungorum]GHP14027.1 hypothetical protein YK48G_14520 [Lentilactobacillus fungorum]
MEKYQKTIPTRHQVKKQRQLVAHSVANAKQKPATRINGLETTVEIDSIIDVGTFPRVKRITKSE